MDPRVESRLKNLRKHQSRWLKLTAPVARGRDGGLKRDTNILSARRHQLAAERDDNGDAITMMIDAYAMLSYGQAQRQRRRGQERGSIVALLQWEIELATR